MLSSRIESSAEESESDTFLERLLAEVVRPV